VNASKRAAAVFSPLRTAVGPRPSLLGAAPSDCGPSLDVDSAASGTSGELGVLPRRQLGVRLAIPLAEALDDDRSGRHVDAERERLGGEDDLDEAAAEEVLNHLLEGREHAGVVSGDAATQALAELLEAEDFQIGVGQLRAGVVEGGVDLGLLLGGGEVEAGLQALLHRLRASGSAEDEDDGREQPLVIELDDGLDA
jgi:hypothetical protein